MPRAPRKVTIRQAAEVMNMKEYENKSANKIAQETGIPRTTIRGILDGVNGWDKVAEGEVFKQYRREQNKALEQAFRSHAAEALAMASTKMDKASYYQLVTGAAISVDKARLYAGESTANVEVHNLVEVQGLDKLCAFLGQSLVPAKSIEVDANEVKTE